MARKFTFELNRSGVRDLLRSQEMREICEGYASCAACSLGEGYEYDARIGKNRANAMVYATYNQTISDAKNNNTIMKALQR